MDLILAKCSSAAAITPWRFSPRGIAVRLFLTCWLVYSLHFATNIVREIYLALALGDHFSFRVDEYANLHDDLFEKKGYGWHVGSNPGAPMLAAVSYAVFRPAIDAIVERVNQRRAAGDQAEPPSYASPYETHRAFYREAWRRGLDVKFGLAAFVMQSLCMAPSSALAVVAMFYLLRQIFRSDKTALWLALLYAFGTPVFFRTGFLNHNLMLGHIAFLGFLAMWNPGGSDRWATQTRYLLGGLAGGTALLFDYSGVVLLLGLFCYGVIKRWRDSSPGEALRHGCWYVLGALPSVALLWFYQWKCFGHPLYPPQHWMPPVEWIEQGYRGYSWPQLQLLVSLAWDYRYGLFVSSPILLLALLCPFVNRRRQSPVPWLELTFLLAIPLALWVFFSGVAYTRWQFNTGIRYLSPVFPFLFVPTAVVLLHLGRAAMGLAATLSVAEAWCLAMYRDVAGGKVELGDPDRGLGVLDPVLQIFLGGFKLPWLTTLSRLGGPYREYIAGGVSPLPVFVLMAAILWVIWQPLSQSAVE